MDLGRPKWTDTRPAGDGDGVGHRLPMCARAGHAHGYYGGCGKRRRTGHFNRKRAESLELAHRIQAVVLDKTGTITSGKPILEAVQWTENADIVTWQNVWFSLEKKSGHPLADAVAAHLEAQAVPVGLSQLKSLTGKGVMAEYKGHQVFAGNLALMHEFQINLSEVLENQAGLWAAAAKTVVCFADHKQVLAIAAITDPVKPTSAAAVQALHQMGVEVYLLTGDNPQTAAAVAAQVGIEYFRAGVMPADKEAFVGTPDRREKSLLWSATASTTARRLPAPM